jgi:hemerythrin
MARQLDELHKKNKEILGKLEALMAQGGQSWKEIKALVFQILEDLKDAFEKGADTSRLKKV